MVRRFLDCDSTTRWIASRLATTPVQYPNPALPRTPRTVSEATRQRKLAGELRLAGPRWFRYGALKGACSVWHETAMGFECGVAAVGGVKARFGRTDLVAGPGLEECGGDVCGAGICWREPGMVPQRGDRLVRGSRGAAAVNPPTGCLLFGHE